METLYHLGVLVGLYFAFGALNPNTSTYSPSSSRSFGSIDDGPGLVNVRGYTRSDGTPVRAHTRTSPDGDPSNNFSSPTYNGGISRDTSLGSFSF